MKKLLPNTIWILEDEPDAVLNIKEVLEIDDSNDDQIKAEDDINEAKKWFTESEGPPDVFVLDIFLKKGEHEIIEKPDKSFSDYVKLAEISGIQFLSWIRCKWPYVPVCIQSAYWDEKRDLPHLAQHAVCKMLKKEIPSIGTILWIAQQAIIGIRLPDKLSEPAEEIITEVNSIQNHFYFVLCKEEKALIAPPKVLNNFNTNQPNLRLLFEVWNNRVLGLIEDISLENEEPPFHPTLPFSRSILQNFSTRLSKEIDFMGSKYLAPYLLRTLTRTVYNLFFNIKSHPVKSGNCVFDDSSYAPDLLKGIERGAICPICQSQMIPHHAYGGWSKGRNEAAQIIAEYMKKTLK